MNDVKIRIDRLGAVRNAEISLRPLMLFTGESGLGKSYVAFIAHYIYVILTTDRLKHFFDNYDFNEMLKNAVSGETILTISTSDLFSWMDSDAISYIRYMVGHDDLDGKVKISWPYSKQRISFIYVEELEGLENDEEMVYSIKADGYAYNKISNLSKIDAVIFQKLVQANLTKSIFGENIRFTDYVLPPSRGALLELGVLSVFRSGMYEEFSNLKDGLMRPLKKQKEEDPMLDKLLVDVNNGSVGQRDGQFIYTTSNGIPMPLTAAASSVKELAPFAMLLKKFELSKCSILFEEPEAHLHPRRQQHVAELIAYALNNGANMQVTTHSDYFVKQLNMLLRLCKLCNKMDNEKKTALLKKVGIQAATLLNPSLINAYYLSRNEDGTSTVKQLDIEANNMIPFDSFEPTIMADFAISDIIEEAEVELEEE